MKCLEDKIWSPDGNLLPIEFADAPLKDLAIVIVNRDRRDLTDFLCEQIRNLSNNGVVFDLYVVDIGSQPEGRSPFTTIEYEDMDFRGKCYAHNVGIRQAALSANYRYYFVMMNDLRFDNQPYAMTRMLHLMETNLDLGILSPTNIGEGKEYVGASPQKGQDFRKVPFCDYLALMIRSEILREVGFLNPEFRYCWGAILELSHKIYRSGRWCVAYCDTVHYEHLGGTTYGKIKNAVSRDEYVENAKKFAAQYFIRHYGSDWDKKFESLLPADVTNRGTYSRHRKYWEGSTSLRQSIMNKLRKVISG